VDGVGVPAGRPRKVLDAEGIQHLASIGCTQAEIASFYGVAQSTISENYRLDYELGNSQSKIVLRKRQWNASKRSVPMMIHLGKNMLGQSDRAEVKQTIETPSGPIAILPAKELHEPETSAGTTDEVPGNDG
jgi:hypothetical protein